MGDAFGKLTVQTTNTDGSMRSLGDILKDCRGAFPQMSESEQTANAEALVVMNASPGDIEKLTGLSRTVTGRRRRWRLPCRIILPGRSRF